MTDFKKTLLISIALMLSSCSRLVHKPVSEFIPTDFITDGCTFFPDESALHKDESWKHCCVAHDMEYWIGGSSKAREAADKELSQCVGKVKDGGLGALMKLGVFIGGSPNYLTQNADWAWGYGHPAPFTYHNFSDEEKLGISIKLHTVLLEYLLKKDEFTKQQLSYLLERFDHRVKSDYQDVLSNRDKKLIESLKKAITKK
jgi:hypothetical protein